jgi:hypothetical protein
MSHIVQNQYKIAIIAARGFDVFFSKSFVMFADNNKANYWELSGDRHFIVLPSLSFDQKELTAIQGILHYEERYLWFTIF